MTTRTCCRCGRLLPLEAFAVDRSLTTRAKRRYHCKECGRKEAKRYRARMSDEQYRRHLDRMNVSKLRARVADRRDRVETAQLMVRRMQEQGLSFAEIARRAGIDVKTPSRILSYGPDVKIARATVDRLMKVFIQLT
jgi:hypothetical protein